MKVVLAKKTRNNIVTITCPYCGKRHRHGATDDENVTHRGAHCTDVDLKKAKLTREDVLPGYAIILRK